jgi:hypothetical protein
VKIAEPMPLAGCALRKTERPAQEAPAVAGTADILLAPLVYEDVCRSRYCTSRMLLNVSIFRFQALNFKSVPHKDTVNFRDYAASAME